jgi:hypothetical protein
MVKIHRALHMNNFTGRQNWKGGDVCFACAATSKPPRHILVRWQVSFPIKLGTPIEKYHFDVSRILETWNSTLDLLNRCKALNEAKPWNN